MSSNSTFNSKLKLQEAVNTLNSLLPPNTQIEKITRNYVYLKKPIKFSLKYDPSWFNYFSPYINALVSDINKMPDLLSAIYKALIQNKKIKAIQLIRNFKYLSLYEAKILISKNLNILNRTSTHTD